MLLIAVVGGYLTFLVLFVAAWSRILAGPKASDLQQLSDDLDQYVADFNGWPQSFEEWAENFSWTQPNVCQFNKERAEWAESRRAEVSFESRWPGEVP